MEHGRATRSLLCRLVKRCGFTLIELLVVIAIVGLLMGGGIPAYQNLGRGAGIDSATAQLRSTISLARQWAITHRERVYIVFPVANPPGLEGYAYRSFNVFSPSDGYLREWILLREGLVFEPTHYPGATATMNVFHPDNRMSFYSGDDDRFGFAGTVQPVLIARPDGRVFRRDHSTQNSRLYLMEGFVEDSGPAERPGEPLKRTLNIRAVTGGVEQSDGFEN